MDLPVGARLPALAWGAAVLLDDALGRQPGHLLAHSPGGPWRTAPLADLLVAGAEVLSVAQQTVQHLGSRGGEEGVAHACS